MSTLKPFLALEKGGVRNTGWLTICEYLITCYSENLNNNFSSTNSGVISVGGAISCSSSVIAITNAICMCSMLHGWSFHPYNILITYVNLEKLQTLM